MKEDSYTIEIQRCMPLDRLFLYVERYSDRGFDDLPAELQQELRYSGYLPVARKPTQEEIWETVSDAREHRIVNKELTIQDYLDHYKHGRSISNVTG